MTATAKDKARGERLLRQLQVDLMEVSAFSFMKRPKEGNTYGAGILCLRLTDGTERVTVLKPRHRPSSIVRYLVDSGVVFDNLNPPPGKPAMPLRKQHYRRPSLYMLWFLLLFLASMTLGWYLLDPEDARSVVPALACFGVALYLLSMLLTRFCYVTLAPEALVVHSAGRSIRYPYEELVKVNFEFARELTFTHVMEVIDKKQCYRLFYIGRTSRKSLPEITDRLVRAGVDATCSLNPEKRYYEDKHLYH